MTENTQKEQKAERTPAQEYSYQKQRAITNWTVTGIVALCSLGVLGYANRQKILDSNLGYAIANAIAPNTMREYLRKRVTEDFAEMQKQRTLDIEKDRLRRRLDEQKKKNAEEIAIRKAEARNRKEPVQRIQPKEIHSNYPALKDVPRTNRYDNKTNVCQRARVKKPAQKQNSCPNQVSLSSNQRKGNPITPDFISHIIRIESRGNPYAVGTSGERGLMQLMDTTWREQTEIMYGKPLPFNLAFNPQKNKEVGTNRLKYLDNYLSNNLSSYRNLPVIKKQDFIAAAYNGGHPRLLRKGGNLQRMPRRTRNYVKQLNQYRKDLASN